MKRLWTSLALVALSGCGVSESREGLTRSQGNLGQQASGSGEAKGWQGCDEALAKGVTGDVCDFGGSCMVFDESIAGTPGQTALCFEGRLVRTSLVREAGRAPCGPPTPVGRCVSYGATECFNPGGSGGQGGALADLHLACVEGVTSATSGRPTITLATADDCQAAQAAHARNGDPCAGSEMCEGFWDTDPRPDVASGEFILMWCDAGVLRFVDRQVTSGW
jgi:hypothetical protein